MTHATPRSPALAPLIVSAALLMETTDATVLATALPVIAGALNAPVLSLKLALASYLVALAVFIPVSGWVADKIGAKPTFMAAIGVFLVGSLLCALQTSLLGLVLARAVQGLGGAMMTPVGRLIVLHSTPKRELVRAMTFITLPALLGPALGPLIGSLVAASAGWRWIFLINLPIGILGLALAWRFLPSPPVEPHPRFDWAGFSLAGASLGAALFGLSALGDHLIATPAAASLILAGGAGLFLYWRRALRAPSPLLDPRLFDRRTFRIGILGGLLFRTSGGAASFLLPLLFQLGFGFSIIVSGALSGVFALGSLIMRGLAPGLIDRFGFRTVLAAGTLVSGASLAGFAAFQSFSPWLLVLLVLTGAAQAAVFTAANGVAYADIDEARMSRATSLAAVSQQAAVTLGIAIAASALQAGGDPAPHAPPLAAHFAPAFLAIAIVSTCALILFLALRRGDGDGLRQEEADHRRAHGL